MIEQYGVFIQITGLALIVVGWLWLASRAFRHRIGWGLATLFPPAAPVYGLWRLRFVRGPMVLMTLGLVATAAPPAYHGLAPVDLGPRDKMVDGDRHLTLPAGTARITRRWRDAPTSSFCRWRTPT